MNPRHNSVTLIELLIAISLLSVVVLGFSSIDLFSRYHVLTSSRRAQLQNEVSYVLEHMSKEINKAVGNRAIAGQAPTVTGASDIRIHIDSNGDTVADQWIGYRLYYPPGPNPEDYQIQYCSNCSDASCTTCNVNWDTIARRVRAFTPSDLTIANYVDVQLTACWDPDESPNACGTPDNPSVTMSTRIKMPSVSTN